MSKVINILDLVEAALGKKFKAEQIKRNENSVTADLGTERAIVRVKVKGKKVRKAKAVKAKKPTKAAA